MTLTMCYYWELEVTLIYGTYLWPVTYTCKTLNKISQVIFSILYDILYTK